MIYNQAAFDDIPGEIQDVARSVSEFLESRGIPHALAGGMAVGAYSTGRMTNDVDFVIPYDEVSRETWESVVSEFGEPRPFRAHGGGLDGLTVNVGGTDVDFLLMVDFPDDLLEGGPIVGGIRVLRPEAVFLMKLRAGREKDVTDVVNMLKSGLVDLKSVRRYVKRHAPDMVDDLDSSAMMADFEKTRQAPAK